MKQSVVVLATVAVLAVAATAWALWPSDAVDSPQQTGAQRVEDTAGAVTVLADFAARDAPADPLRVTVTVDTHTVDLSGWDPVANVVLESSAGTFAPSGDSRMTDNTGHHLVAELTFAGVPRGDAVLVVRDLGGIDERRLEVSL